MYGKGPSTAKLVKFKAVITVESEIGDFPRFKHERPTIQNDNFVCSVDIKTLSEREQNRIIIDSRVCRSVVNSDRSMCKTRNEFLDVSYSLNASYWRPESRVVPELKVKANHNRVSKPNQKIKGELTRN